MDVAVCPLVGDQGLQPSPDRAATGSDGAAVNTDDIAGDAASREAEDDLAVGSWAQPIDSPDASRRRSLSGGSRQRKSFSSEAPRRASLGSCPGLPPPSMPSRGSLGQSSVNMPEVLDQAGESLNALLLPEPQNRPAEDQEIELADINTAKEAAPSVQRSSNGTCSARGERTHITMAKEFSMSRVHSQISEIKDELEKHGVDYDDFGLTGRKSALACLLGTVVLFVVMILFVVLGRSSTPEERAAAEQKHREHLMKSRMSRRGRLAAFLQKQFHKNVTEFDGQDLFGVEINTEGDAKALGVVFWTSMLTCCLIFMLFICFKRQWPIVFYGRNRDGDNVVSRLYSTVIDRVEDNEADAIIERAGLDAWMLLQYYSMNCRLLRLIGSINILVLCPLHWLSDPSRVCRLSSIGINNLPDASWAFWVHAVVAFVVVVVASEIVHAEHLLFLKFRFSWLRALPRPQATTLMVQNIPAEFRSDAALRNYFAQFEFQKDSVERAYMVRRSSSMNGLVNEVKDALNDVKDAQDKLLRQLRLREKSEQRCRLSESEHSDLSDESDAFSHSGFVTFSSRRAAMSASERQYRADPREFHVQFAPEPSDVRYDELAATQVRGLIKDATGTLCLVLVFVNCAPVVLLITSLMSIDHLSERWPELDKYMQRGGTVQAFLTGLLGTGLLKFFMLMLPKILLLIINHFFSLKAASWAQLVLQKWYYGYQMLFVVLATTIGASLLSAIVEVLDDPTIIFVVLAESLPETSHTYLNFVVLSCAFVSLEILRPVRLVKYNIFRFFMPQQEAYISSQSEDPAFTGMGSRMTKAVTLTTVVLLYCSCAPLICFFGYIYFFIGRSVHAFLYRFAEEKKPDLGGAFWVEAVNHVFVAILLFLVLMLGILGTRSSNQWPAVLAASSMVVLFWRWHCCRTYVWKQLPFDEVLRLDLNAELDTASSVRVGEYIQPECRGRVSNRQSELESGIWH